LAKLRIVLEYDKRHRDANSAKRLGKRFSGRTYAQKLQKPYITKMSFPHENFGSKTPKHVHLSPFSYSNRIVNLS